MRVQFTTTYDLPDGARTLRFDAGEVADFSEFQGKQAIAAGVAELLPEHELGPTSRVRMLRTIEEPGVTYRKGEQWHFPESRVLELIDGDDPAVELDPDPGHDPIAATTAAKREQADARTKAEAEAKAAEQAADKAKASTTPTTEYSAGTRQSTRETTTATTEG
ncbi:MAG: hypothetical protein JWO05_1149 [Gemmatimonadetes bacterium]|nr:hypothetical protein [Gemmatimonadota bacterium]